MNNKGLFVTLSGVDGCGKTTIARDVVIKLHTDHNLDVMYFDLRFDKFSRSIMDLIMNYNDLSPDTEARLFTAIFQNMWDRYIGEYRKNMVVVSDRWIDDTIVYQYMTQGARFIPKLNYERDLGILLDIDPKIGLERINKSREDKIDRIDKKPLAFHRQVRENFQTHFSKLQQYEKNKFMIINADDTIESLSNQICEAIVKRVK